MGNANLAKLGEGEEYELSSDPDAPVYDLSHKEQATVVQNRLLYFSQMGFPLNDALTLAKRRDVDHYRAKVMLQDGASHELVAGILL